MSAKPLALLALVAVAFGVAMARREDPSDPFSAASLELLLASPLDAAGKRDEAARQPFWRALLAHPAVTRTPEGLSLRLGRVLSDPTAARGAANSAGELLALEAEGPQGPLGMPLWRAVLEGPATTHDDGGRTLALYGCRHSADADAGPALEDSYHARLSLAASLSKHALAEPGAAPLTLLGQNSPVKGGVNFEVQLLGEVQSVVVTFDGEATPALRAARTFRPPAPNDARARENLIAALRERAEAEGLGPLTIEGEEAPVANGIDLRLEQIGQRLSLVASRGGGGRLATHIEAAPSAPREQP